MSPGHQLSVHVEIVLDIIVLKVKSKSVIGQEDTEIFAETYLRKFYLNQSLGSLLFQNVGDFGEDKNIFEPDVTFV